ncbi:MAG: Dabb family protein [Opitutales bacterium]
MITHFVVMRTPMGKNQKELLEGLNTLKEIKGNYSLHFGCPLASARPVVDDTFTVALSLTCDSQEALSAYLVDPIHVKFGENYLKKYDVKITVYDVQS